MKRFVKSFMLASLAVLLASCNCYNKMLKKVDRIDVSATPAVVTLKGNNAVTDIKVNFPAKYFNKRAVLKITPVLVFEGGEIAGTPKFVQGREGEGQLRGDLVQAGRFVHPERIDSL